MPWQALGYSMPATLSTIPTTPTLGTTHSRFLQDTQMIVKLKGVLFTITKTLCQYRHRAQICHRQLRQTMFTMQQVPPRGPLIPPAT